MTPSAFGYNTNGGFNQLILIQLITLTLQSLCLVLTLNGKSVNLRKNFLIVFLLFSSYKFIDPALTPAARIEASPLKVECDCAIVVEHIALIEFIEERKGDPDLANCVGDLADY